LKQEISEQGAEQGILINDELNEINRTIQRLQREAGKSFVSRTTLQTKNLPEQDIVVLRCVIMNPMTNIEILKEILDEQEEIYQRTFIQG
jgi:glutamate decarboxylase